MACLRGRVGEIKMPVIELTDGQVIALVQQLPADQKKRVLEHLSQPDDPQKSARFGSGRNHIEYIAPDFDAPLDEFKDYM